jgi:hypothetical protein
MVRPELVVEMDDNLVEDFLVQEWTGVAVELAEAVFDCCNPKTPVADMSERFASPP